MIISLGKIQGALIEVENLKNELEEILVEYDIDSVAMPNNLDEEENNNENK